MKIQPLEFTCIACHALSFRDKASYPIVSSAPPTVFRKTMSDGRSIAGGDTEPDKTVKWDRLSCPKFFHSGFLAKIYMSFEVHTALELTQTKA
jgi:hypothetical protein